ncbi:succinate dehydrogenase cytochrome b556 subunit [Paraglaciecola arctica BSs20135]|uniref:Succinate dehydrogenase cytochrome b556 subunit n=2 Tax=Paraglaciecola TaxID=1621534 RepID=K6XBL2_9ALTE|nr:succinate dehydrogenase cytochrome b556 subunit [Paraglaciecola arctica BSs20135]
MFFALMFVIWAWATSVSSIEGFAFVQEQMAGPLGKFVAIGTISALTYHVLGGVRHMIMDLGYWEELQSGDISAKAIIVAWIILTILVGVVLW